MGEFHRMIYVKLTAKSDTWFKAGAEVFSNADRRFTLDEWEEWRKSGIIVCSGLRVCEDNDNENGNGYKPGEIRWDGECCCCDEFEVEFVDYSGIKQCLELQNEST